jgi:hypothetical protein
VHIYVCVRDVCERERGGDMCMCVWVLRCVMQRYVRAHALVCGINLWNMFSMGACVFVCLCVCRYVQVSVIVGLKEKIV